MHTTESDGRESLETMVAAAQARGLEYIAITDHSQSLAMANGLDETRAWRNAGTDSQLFEDAEGHHRARRHRVRHPRRRLAWIWRTIASPSLDIVVASVHSALTQDEARHDRARDQGDRASVGGHHRPPHRRACCCAATAPRVNVEKVIDAARANGVALEINSQPHRLDLCDSHARLARDRGVKLVIDSDAH